MANGQSFLVHIDTIHISKYLILSDVLRLPFFTFKPISISKLTKSPTCCHLFSHDLSHSRTDQLEADWSGCNEDLLFLFSIKIACIYFIIKYSFNI